MRFFIFSAILFLTSFADCKPSLQSIDARLYRGFLTGKTVAAKDIQGYFEIVDQLQNKKIYAASENPFLQESIDQAAYDILQTRIGLDICSLLGADSTAIQNELGLSTAMAEKASRDCGKSLKQQNFNKPEKLFKKQYYFVLSDKKGVFDSWTTMYNSTFIFLYGIETKQELYQKLVHEWVIGYDYKFPMHTSTVNAILDDFKIEVADKDKEKLDTLLRNMASPLIKGSFAMMRAYLCEYWTLQDLSQKYEINQNKVYQTFLNFKSSDDVYAAFKDISDQLMDLQVYYLPHEYSYLDMDARKVAGKEFFFDSKIRDQFIQAMKNVDVHFRSSIDHTSFNFVNYMTFPSLGIANVYVRGPRPRLGGGWDVPDNNNPALQNFNSTEDFLATIKKLNSQNPEAPVWSPDFKPQQTAPTVNTIQGILNGSTQSN